MLKTVVRIVQIAFFALGAAALAWFLWGKLSGERQRDLDPWERMCAERAVDALVDAIPRRDAIKRMLVMPVEGDLDGRVSDMLWRRIQERPEYVFIDGRSYQPAQKPADVKEALELVDKIRKSQNPQGVLVSRVERVTPRDGVGTKVDIEAHLIPLPDDQSALDKARRFAGAWFPSLAPDDAKAAESAGETVHPPAETITTRFSVDWWAGAMEATSRFERLAAWLLFTGGLPFALMSLVQAVTRRENNRLNAAMLAGFVAADGLAALFLMGLRIGASGWVLLLFAGFAGFLYDFVICDRIDEMRK
jgi:hypothetical protein